MNPPLLLVMRYAKEAFKVTTSQGKTYTVPKVRSVLGWGAGTDNRRPQLTWQRGLWGMHTSQLPTLILSLPLLTPPGPFPAAPLQGHIVAASPTFSHRLPHIFNNADAYEPDRFMPVSGCGPALMAGCTCACCSAAKVQRLPGMRPFSVCSFCASCLPLQECVPGSLSYPPSAFFCSPLALQPREEDKPVPFSYIGFGGGRHGCMVSGTGCLGARQGVPQCGVTLQPRWV